MHIKIERPRDRIDQNVRVYLDGVDISHAVQAVTVPMRVGDLSTVTLKLTGDIEIVTTPATARKHGPPVAATPMGTAVKRYVSATSTEPLGPL